MHPLLAAAGWEPSMPSQTTPGKGSSRRRPLGVRRACGPCRRRHAACSEQRPCTRCVRLGKACVDKVEDVVIERPDPKRCRLGPGADGCLLETMVFPRSLPTGTPRGSSERIVQRHTSSSSSTVAGNPSAAPAPPPETPPEPDPFAPDAAYLRQLRELRERFSGDASPEETLVTMTSEAVQENMRLQCVNRVARRASAAVSIWTSVGPSHCLCDARLMECSKRFADILECSPAACVRFKDLLSTTPPAEVEGLTDGCPRLLLISREDPHAHGVLFSLRVVPLQGTTARNFLVSLQEGAPEQDPAAEPQQQQSRPMQETGATALR